MKNISLNALLFIFLIHCKDVTVPSNHGIVIFIKGQATHLHKKKESKITLGKIIEEGDQLKTFENSTVIVSFSNGESEAEIQSNTLFYLNTYNEKKAELAIDSGNIWFRVNQKNKKNYSLSNPTAVAGVRGTKFFTFQLDDKTFGTCHCEGKVMYTVRNSSDAKENTGDYIIAVRNGKSIVITATEIKALFPDKLLGHNHSEIENSPLGKQNLYSMNDRLKIKDLVEKKMK